MIKRKAFKFRLVPEPEHRLKLAQFVGCNRVVWNKAWALIKASLEKNEKVERYNTIAKRLPVWKKDEALTFLGDSPSQPLQQTLKDLDRALSDFFKKQKGAPRFKKKGQSDSFRYPQGFKFGGNKVFLPKIGWVKFKRSQKIEGTPKNVTVSKRAGKWYIAIQVEMEVEQPVHPNMDFEVGIDMGIARFATLSDGNILKPHNAYCQNQKKLAKAQHYFRKTEMEYPETPQENC